MKPHPHQSQVQDHEQPHAGFAQMSLERAKSPETMSLQVSLEVVFWPVNCDSIQR